MPTLTADRLASVLTPMQLRTYRQARGRINIAHGPVRAGKTVGLEIYRWAAYVRSAPPGDLLMTGKTLKTLERNVLRPTQDVFGQRRVRYSLGKKEAFYFGRRIELEGANDAQAEGKIRGMTLAGALGNELTLWPEDFFRQVFARMSVDGAAFFGSTNADSPYHWLKTGYLDREADLRAAGSDIRQWRFALEDNTFLSPTYVAALKAEYGPPSSLWYRRFILGMWVQAAGAVYDMWDERLHLAPPAAPAVTTPAAHVVGVDYGTSNPTAFLHLEAGSVLAGHAAAHVAREDYYDGRTRGQRTDAQHADALADFLAPIPGRPPVYIDPSAASFIAACRAKRIAVREADNAVVDGLRFVSSLLGAARLTVAPGCANLRREFSAYVWDERAQRRGEDAPLKTHDHALDALRYALWTHLGGERRTKGGTTATL